MAATVNSFMPMELVELVPQMGGEMCRRRTTGALDGMCRIDARIGWRIVAAVVLAELDDRIERFVAGWTGENRLDAGRTNVGDIICYYSFEL